jgi:probable rRNA maturation factor
MTQLEVQIASGQDGIPTEQQFQIWVDAVLGNCDAELVIRVVDEAEGTELNGRYRHKSYPTNVLSFPFEAPPGIDINILGDLVICAPVVSKEAQEQDKAPEAHWAHLVIHGLLHLQGYDHEDEPEAAAMEAREIAILRELGFPNPYEVEQT